MTGYQLLEHDVMAPRTPTGVTPHPDQIGFLDFLRELAGEPFPLPRYSEIRVVGLEEVLFAARPEETALALEIHRRLRQVAPELERQLLSVQVIFRGTLVRGDSLWSEFSGSRLPIDRIFGSPPPENDGRGNRFFRANFNLTNA